MNSTTSYIKIVNNKLLFGRKKRDRKDAVSLSDDIKKKIQKSRRQNFKKKSHINKNKYNNDIKMIIPMTLNGYQLLTCLFKCQAFVVVIHVIQYLYQPVMWH